MAQDVYDGALEICRTLQGAGFEAYLVGGCVRDALLGTVPKDFDVATAAAPAQVRKLFALATEVTPSEAYGVVIVSVGDNRYEVATFRRDIGTDDNRPSAFAQGALSSTPRSLRLEESLSNGRRPSSVEFSSLEDDAARRDFTVNALYLDPVTMQLIDLVGGIDDLDTRTLRFIGDPRKRIAEDRLRVLRAVRFKNRLGFDYAPETEVALRIIAGGETPTYSPLTRGRARGYLLPIKPERVQAELTRIFLHPSRAAALQDLEKLGLLKIWLPEVARCRGVKQPPKYHSEGDVLTHIGEVLKNLPDKPSKVLVWAALLHDIGKPDTTKIGTDGQLHCLGHAEVGVRLTLDLLQRLRFSRREREDIIWLVQCHMMFMMLEKMQSSKRELLMRHRLASDLFQLYLADSHGSWYEDKVAKEAEIVAVSKLWQEFRHRPRRELSDIGIDGRWVMTQLGLKTGGPVVKQTLERLNIELLEGKIKNQADAAGWVKKNY